MAVDLHIHSTASDGGFTPMQVVDYAKKVDLTCIALTDHDTIQGLAEADERAREIDIRLIPGIELTSMWGKNEIHVLGYFIDYTNTEVIAELAKQQGHIYRRIAMIVSKLNEMNIEISMDEAEEVAAGARLCRPHVARTMVDRGYANTTQDVFDFFIGAHAPAYVRPTGFSAQEAYDFIHLAGGIATIAHPGFLGRAEMMTEDDILAHRGMGLEAIEVLHPKHDRYMVDYYTKVAQKFGLLITGGSDCHGTHYNRILLGKKSVPDWVAEKMFEYQKSKSR